MSSRPEANVDIYDVLSEDHFRILDLVRSLRASGTDDSDCMFDELGRALAAHLRTEEEVLSPALRRDAGNDDLASWGEAEHRQIELIAADLADMVPGDRHWRTRLHDLENVLTAHFEEEEARTFERLHGLLAASAAEALGRTAAALLARGRSERPNDERPAGASLS